MGVTVWGLWWFAQEWAGAALNGPSALVNHPYGAEGTVLAPVSSAVFTVLRAGVGNILASNLLGVVVLAGLAGAAAWTVRGLGLGWSACVAAGLAMFVCRYPVYGLGEASVVGITAVPLVVGLGAFVRGRVALAALCACLTAVEYPYLILVLPGLLLARGGLERSGRWVAAGFLALGLAWLGTRFVGRGQVMGFSSAHFHQIGWLGMDFPVVEEAKARSVPGDLFWPGSVRWRLSTRPEDLACGRDYLGVSVILLAALGWRRGRWWALLAGVGAALATGSNWWGFPAPFSWLNLLASSVVRGLTQPTRFLLLANVGLAIAAAYGVERLGRWRWVGVGLLGLDAVLLGGLALRMPTLPLPQAECVRALAGRSGVIVWPWDARASGDASLQTRYWQMEHGQPGASFGVGSWRLGEGVRAIDSLARAGLREGAPIPVERLVALRYDTVVVDRAAAGELVGLGEPFARCTGADVYFLDGSGR